MLPPISHPRRNSASTGADSDMFARASVLSTSSAARAERQPLLSGAPPPQVFAHPVECASLTSRLLLQWVLNQLQFRSLERLRRAREDRQTSAKEMVHAMPAVKLHAWEPAARARINATRGRELAALWRFQVRGAAEAAFNFAMPVLVATAALAVGYHSSTHPLTPASAFATLALVRLMQTPLRTLPDAVLGARSARQSLHNLSHFMDQEELNPYAVARRDSLGMVAKYDPQDVVVAVEDATLGWATNGPVIFQHLDVTVGAGELLVVHGRPGSGKSSFLSALLGEMQARDGSDGAGGRVYVGGSVAYCPQQSWLQQTLSVRDNVLFGLPFDRRKYQRVLDACALVNPLAMLSAGDHTLVQDWKPTPGLQALVSLARACYSDADVYLLDDLLARVHPRSAAREIFSRCLLGLLRNKTRIVVTTRAEFINSEFVDDAIRFEDGGRLVHTRDIYESKGRKEQDGDEDSDEEQEEAAEDNWVHFSASGVDVVRTDEPPYCPTEEPADIEQLSVENIVNTSRNSLSERPLRAARLYLRPARDLLHLERTARQAARSHATETLAGARVVRAFGLAHVHRVLGHHFWLLDVAARDAHLGLHIDQWLALRVQLYGTVIVGIVAASSFLALRYTLSASVLALALYEALVVDNGALESLVRVWAWLSPVVPIAARTQAAVRGAEVITESAAYSTAAARRASAPLTPNEVNPSLSWPTKGDLRFDAVSFRDPAAAIVDELTDMFEIGDGGAPPLALKGVSFRLQAGEKVAILESSAASSVSSVGRALLRLHELTAGRIVVDGVDVATLGLRTLRSRVACVSAAAPNAALYDGSVRTQLDPSGRDIEDERLWTALRAVGLADNVATLDGPFPGVASLQQNPTKRFLLSLARALLSEPSVVALAFAPVLVPPPGDESQLPQFALDDATLETLQRVVHEELRDATVLLLLPSATASPQHDQAQRAMLLNAVDRVLVVVDGEIAELGSPADLAVPVPDPDRLETLAEVPSRLELCDLEHPSEDDTGTGALPEEQRESGTSGELVMDTTDSAVEFDTDSAVETEKKDKQTQEVVVAAPAPNSGAPLDLSLGTRQAPPTARDGDDINDPLEFFRQCYQLEEDPFTLYTQALLLKEQREFAMASELLRSLLSTASVTLEARHHLAQCLIAQDPELNWCREEAQQCLEDVVTAMKSSSNNEDAHHATMYRESLELLAHVTIAGKCFDRAQQLLEALPNHEYFFVCSFYSSLNWREQPSLHPIYQLSTATDADPPDAISAELLRFLPQKIDQTRDASREQEAQELQVSDPLEGIELLLHADAATISFLNHSPSMVVLRFSASKVALVTGLHDFGDVAEELLDCVYQDREELLARDAARLRLRLVSKDEELELLVQKSGAAAAPQLRGIAMGQGSSDSRARGGSSEATRGRGQAAEDPPSVGTRNESLALEAYERQTGSKVRLTNEHFYFLTFPRPPETGTQEEAPPATVALKRKPRRAPEATAGAVDLTMEEEEDGYFSICGMVDGVADALTISVDDEWGLTPVVVEVKNRVRGFRSPPPLYDHIQLAVYMKMLEVEHGNLVQCIYGADPRPTIQVLRVSLGVPPLCLPASSTGQERDIWTEVIVPRLYSFTETVQKLRDNELLRLAYLNGTEEERRAMLRAECDFL
ncbi:P-loop containing nucleoside triphosphate hydrolase [Phytophthora cactorum]|nr:P-loop containing nucleoside triphosphate hydrolase [Phytophthora cactorum]